MLHPSLDGKRVLIVEDEFIIAAVMSDALRDQGCEVVGPHARLDQALKAAGREAIDIAVLDVNLIGGLVFPVADILQERGVPFVVTTGCGISILSHHRDWRVLAKPYRVEALVATLAERMLPADAY